MIRLSIMSKRYTPFYISFPSTASASKTVDYVTERNYLYDIREYTLNSTFINKKSDPNSRASIRIHARNPISVLAEYRINSYVVKNPILPVSLLSTSYVVPSYPRNSASGSKATILVAALNDSTIHIKHYGISETHSIQANKTFIYESYKDISGASITSNYPVAVFSSVDMGSHDFNSHSTTYDLSMQVPPIMKDALHFIIPSLPSDITSYKVRIYSTNSGAHVDIHSTSDSVKHMHVYENIFYEYTAKGSTALEIFSDNPIMVVQVALDSHGNAAFMTNIPATSQFMTSYLTDQSHTAYIVTVRYEEALGLLVDGYPLIHNPETVLFLLV